MSRYVTKVVDNSDKVTCKQLLLRFIVCFLWQSLFKTFFFFLGGVGGSVKFCLMSRKSKKVLFDKI